LEDLTGDPAQKYFVATIVKMRANFGLSSVKPANSRGVGG
jgi:hypothetical protein